MASAVFVFFLLGFSTISSPIQMSVQMTLGRLSCSLGGTFNINVEANSGVTKYSPFYSTFFILSIAWSLGKLRSL